MTRLEKIAAAAPMPKSEEAINNNSMKLFAYLMCISGLANYPENTRMFRQKNLILTQIKEATGITDKTVKLYLYYLELNHLIIYKGDYQFSFQEIEEKKYANATEYRKTVQKEASEVWKLRRQNEKDGVYYIPRPWQWTPVPEITLERLNKDYGITELELDIYLFCCKYRDECVKTGKNYKAMTYEQFRDILGYVKSSLNDKTIFNSLCFLEKLGLVSFTIGYTNNTKLAKIPLFKIQEVYYYINSSIEFKDEEIMTEDEKQILKRIVEGNEKFKTKINQ